MVDRRVATVFAADVAGYSRLVAEDEDDAIRRLQFVWESVVGPILADNGGRLVKTMGDGLLAEFGDSIASVVAALRLQSEMTKFNKSEVEARSIRFRIGINEGEVVVDGDDLLGDVVNVAARLESMAPVGGICVSRSVMEQTREAVDARMTSLGPQPVKNIPQPIEVWRVEVDGAEVNSLASHASPGVSLAVLPLRIQSDDPDHEFFADGIVEDVTAALSRFGAIFVIARNSAFAHRDRERDVCEIAGSLGVAYVVDGSLRISGARLRLSADLVEANSGRNVWSERWDRTLDDVFAVQDELTEKVVAALAPRVVEEEIRLARMSVAPDLGAWRRCARGLGLYYRFNPDDHAAAVAEFEKSLSIDPEYALARAYLAKALFTQAWLGWSTEPEADIERAETEARKALRAAPSLAEGHYALACALFWEGHTEAALRSIDRCMEINPHFADGHLVRSQILSCLGRFDSAEPAARLALALSPDDPLRWAFLGNLADALFGSERWEEALEAATQACDASPEYIWGHLMVAASAVMAGRKQASRQAFGWLEQHLTESLDELIENYPFAYEKDRRRLGMALSQARQLIA